MKAARADHVVLRRANGADAGALTDLAFRSKRANGYDDAFMNACRDELTVAPAHLAAAEYWLAEAGTIGGFVSLCAGAAPGAGEIGMFFVDPDRLRQGIGKRLWRKVLERATARGMTRVEVDADPFAAPFYEALGFKAIGESPSGSIAGRTIPRMRLDLG